MSIAFRHPAVRRRATRPAAVTAVDAIDDLDSASSGVLLVRFLRLRSVAAFSFVLLLGLAALTVVAAVVAWHLAARWGIVEDLETLMVELGFETFELRPDQLLDIILVVAGAGVVVGTIVAVIAAMVFNLVTRVTGGIEVTTQPRNGDR